MNDTSSNDCLVCRKHRGEVDVPGGVIYENDLIYISHAQLWGEEKEHYLGHVFVETRRHVAEVAGDGVPHVHYHVIGRYPGAPREYWGTKVDEWPDAPKGAEAEITQVAESIRAFLSEKYANE